MHLPRPFVEIGVRFSPGLVTHWDRHTSLTVPFKGTRLMLRQDRF